MNHNLAAIQPESQISEQPLGEAPIKPDAAQEFRFAIGKHLDQRKALGDLAWQIGGKQAFLAEKIPRAKIPDDGIVAAGQLHPTGAQQIHTPGRMVRVKQGRPGRKNECLCLVFRIAATAAPNEEARHFGSPPAAGKERIKSLVLFLF
ncbi:MAG TPA: hypothetical protein VLX58_04255 [Bryobacteraceae bacterium]|nr:hypothetical protein [Bryobacteraceae bacterium]